jgi:hypothetical protein
MMTTPNDQIVSKKLLHNRVIIIDDFYADPYSIREIALTAEYEDKSAGNYPGRNSIKNFWNNDLNQSISQITGEAVTFNNQPFCGKFRFICKDDVAKQIIHFDPSPKQIWAGVIYLNLPEHCEGTNSGTTMYRHKGSGMSVAPFDHIEAQKIGVTTHEDMKVFFETEGLNRSLWSPELKVDNKFNRLVLFRPWMWHAMEDHFGTDITNSRLTQLIFLDEK